VDDRDAGTYSTPPEAAPSERETRSARNELARGLPVLMSSVFVAFVVVALVILVVRYL
jgi:hypothetical protein